MTKENIIIKDFQLYNDINDIQSSNNNHLNLCVEISENTNSLHEELSQIIQNFNVVSIKEIEPSMSSSNQFEDDFIMNMIINDIINILENDVYEVGKQKILNYLDNHNINLQEINNLLLLNNQNNSNFIVLLGKFNYYGIGTSVNKQKAFKLFQKAADLNSAIGLNNLGYCYLKGLGTNNIDKKVAFELFQKSTDFGNGTGMNYLGYCYVAGIGTSIDKKMAFQLYQKAADLGNAIGINNLGYCYFNRIGTNVDK
jgi:hypothetical protein